MVVQGVIRAYHRLKKLMAMAAKERDTLRQSRLGRRQGASPPRRAGDRGARDKSLAWRRATIWRKTYPIAHAQPERISSEYI